MDSSSDTTECKNDDTANEDVEDKEKSGEEVRKTANKKKAISRDATDTGSAQAHIAKMIATSQKKGRTKRRPTSNA